MKYLLDYYGKKWSPDFTCWDFIRLIFFREFGVSLQPHPLAVSEEVHRALSIAETEKHKAEWELIPHPEKNCVALFTKSKTEFHVGFMVNCSNIFHLHRNASSMVEPLREVSKRFESVTYYRNAKICQCH